MWAASLQRSHLLPSAQEGRVLSPHLGQAPHAPQGKPGLVDRLREPSSNASSAHLAGSEPSLQVSTSPLSEQAGLEPSLHRQSPPSLNRGFSAVRAARHGAVRACGLTAVSTAQPVPAPEVKMEEQCIMSSRAYCNANYFVGPTRPMKLNTAMPSAASTSPATRGLRT